MKDLQSGESIIIQPESYGLSPVRLDHMSVLHRRFPFRPFFFNSIHSHFRKFGSIIYTFYYSRIFTWHKPYFGYITRPVNNKDHYHST